MRSPGLATGLALLLLVGCSSELPLTQIVVVVDSEWDEIKTVRFDLDDFGDGEPLDVDIATQPFPLSLALVHEGGPLGPIGVTVSGFVDGEVVAVLKEPREAIVFEKDQTKKLFVELIEGCVGLCEEACVRDGDALECLSAEDAAVLTDWDGNLSSASDDEMDGGSDASAPLDDGGPAPGEDAGDSAVVPTDAVVVSPADASASFQVSNVNPDDPTLDGVEKRQVTFDCGETVFDSGEQTFSNSCGSEPSAVSALLTDDTLATVLVFSELTIAAGSSLRLVGNRPVILLVYGDADIEGVLDASASGSTGGPRALSCTLGLGEQGEDGSGFSAGEGGGGGGYGGPGGTGGNGGSGSPAQGKPGIHDGTYAMTPLRGGCRGGSGGKSNSGAGGGGGGALQVSVEGTLALDGTVSAAGGGGRGTSSLSNGGGGGGSGGTVLLEAGTLEVGDDAWITANGGGGGAGHDGELLDGSMSANGEDGHKTDATVAAGGAGEDGGGSGGNGSVSTDPGANGGNGSTIPFNANSGGGGGGGGVGRIRLNGLGVCDAPGNFSPKAEIICDGCDCLPDTACTAEAFDGTDYIICRDERVSWHGALAACRGVGMDLPRPDEAGKSDYLISELSAAEFFWIGISDMREGQWRFVSSSEQFWSGEGDGVSTTATGTSCTPGDAGCMYSNWAVPILQPDDASTSSGSADCGSVSGENMAWVDDLCTLELAYACEALPR